MSATLPDVLHPYLESETKAGSSALAKIAVEQAHKIGSNGVRLDLALAATFDLLVAAKLYQNVKPEDWLWCEAHDFDVYPMLNACPLCIFENQFVFHEGNKPGSGNIGPATAGALRELLAAHYALTKQTGIRIFNGSEPVDLAVVDDDTKKIFMAEVKASPLFTPPLVVKHTAKSFQSEYSLPLRHAAGIIRHMDSLEVSLLIPLASNEYELWTLPTKGLGDADWPEKAICKAIQDSPEKFERFVLSWSELWKLYDAKDNSKAAFWLTGACGLPRKPGAGWPKKSDGKPKGD